MYAVCPRSAQACRAELGATRACKLVGGAGRTHARFGSEVFLASSRSEAASLRPMPSLVRSWRSLGPPERHSTVG